MLPCCGRNGIPRCRAAFARHGNRLCFSTVPPKAPKKKRRLDVAIVGLPNVGKSQLLNLMTKSVVAAVSRKRHTTREGIMGSRIVTDAIDGSETQLLFVDTPGFLRNDDAKREGVRGTVMNTAKREMKDVDFTLIVVDAAARLTDPVKQTILELMIKAVNVKGRPKDLEDETASAVSELSAAPPPENKGIDDDEDGKQPVGKGEISTYNEDSASGVTSRVDEGGEHEIEKTLNDDVSNTTAMVDDIAARDTSFSVEDKDDAPPGPDEVAEEGISKSEKKKEDEMDNSLQNFAVVLNKTDLVRPKQLLIKMAMELYEMAEACIRGYKGQTDGKEIATAAAAMSVTEAAKDDVDEATLMEGLPTFFYTDCKHNDGIDEIVDFLKRRATPCQEFEVDMLAQPEEQAYEIIREKLYRTLHKEVPYHVNQVNQAFQHVVDPKTGQPGLLITQILIVQTKSHLQLLRGRNLQVILETARRDLVKNFQCPVDLQLSVKLAKSSERTWSV